MSWKSDISIKRLFSTMKRLKTQIFSQDIEALKHLNDAISQSERQYATDNILFSKLLCHYLNQSLHQTGSMKVAISEVGSILKIPLERSIDILSINLKNQELNNYLSSIGIDFNSYDSEEDLIKLHQKEIISKLKVNWTIEKVDKAFVNTVNEFLKDIENYE